MSEEIIIDGMNVAECEHYCEKLNTGSGIIQNPSKQGFCLHNITGLQNADIYFRVLSFPKCREQSNCYYKQLKRLEQENKELKELKCKFKEYCTCDTERLKAENERLKEKLNEWEKELQSNEKIINRLIKENEELKKENKENLHYLACMTEQRNKLKLALEEIRGIAKDNYYSCTDCDKQRKELNCNEKCNAYRLREIQEKINEVLDERN